jgi:anti-sigma28 factor (negative regulator of flagellin synthesis)
VNNARHEASRHFRNEKVEHLKDRITELATHRKSKNIKSHTEEKINLGRVANLELT